MNFISKHIIWAFLVTTIIKVSSYPGGIHQCSTNSECLRFGEYANVICDSTISACVCDERERFMRQPKTRRRLGAPSQSNTNAVTEESFGMHQVLKTPFRGMTAVFGTMFEIDSLKDIQIIGFSVKTAQRMRVPISVFIRHGSYNNDESDSPWTLIQKMMIDTMGMGYPTQLPNLSEPLPLKANEKLSLYFTAPSQILICTEGSSMQEITAENNDLRIHPGLLVEHEFEHYLSGYGWNGFIKYQHQTPQSQNSLPSLETAFNIHIPKKEDIKISSLTIKHVSIEPESKSNALEHEGSNQILESITGTQFIYASSTHPCNANTIWRRRAFNDIDTGHTVTIKGNGPYSIYVDGFLRTTLNMVDVEGISGRLSSGPYTICAVDNLGGQVGFMIQNQCRYLIGGNPIVHFDPPKAPKMMIKLLAERKDEFEAVDDDDPDNLVHMVDIMSDYCDDFDPDGEKPFFFHFSDGDWLISSF